MGASRTAACAAFITAGFTMSPAACSNSRASRAAALTASEIRHRAHPCREAGGVIFTYMGSGEPPLLPNYEFLTVPGEYRTVTKIFETCNYLQGNEGNIDPVHLSFLHQCLDEAQIARRRTVPGSNATDNALLAEDIAPTIEVEITDYGLRIYTLRGTGRDKRYLRITNFVMPNLSVFGGSSVDSGYSIHWHVPVDDTSHWKYIFAFSREKPLDDFMRTRSRTELTADYRLTRNRANRYQQDRESMQTQTFTGMGLNFQAHDAFATESQGPVQDRTAEHLVSSDKAIVAARKLLLNAMKDAQNGRDPQHVIRDLKSNRLLHLQALSAVIPDTQIGNNTPRSESPRSKEPTANKAQAKAVMSDCMTLERKWMIGKLVALILLSLLWPVTLVAQERYNIAYAGFAGFQTPVWATMDLGLLAKYGVNAELIFTPGSTRQIQALVGNSVHFAQVDAVTTINAIAQGADLVMISGSLNTFPFSFVAQKEIRRPEDLNGKKVGIVGFGGANELAILLALKEWNLPRQAITILQAGGASQRLVALSAKALDATVLAQPELGEAMRMGMNVLAHMRDMKTAAFPMNAMVVRRSFLQQNRELVKRFQQAYAEATYQLLNHKDKAMAVLATRLQQKNPKAIEETYQYIATSFAFPTRIAPQGIRNTLDMVAQRNPKVDMNPAKYVDESILDELEKEGFFKRITGK